MKRNSRLGPDSGVSSEVSRAVGIVRMFMTVVRSKCQGVQMHGDHMFWGTKIIGPKDSEVTKASRSRGLRLVLERFESSCAAQS